MPCGDQLADFYEQAVQVLEERGLSRYEVSNFASSSHTAQSIHNKGYWQASQYLGVGPGAHTRIVPSEITQAQVLGNSNDFSERERPSQGYGSGCKDDYIKGLPEAMVRGGADGHLMDVIREARVNAADPVSWLQEVKHKGTGVRKVEKQTRLDVASEYLASGLRTTEGVTEARWSCFVPYITLFDIFNDKAKWLQEEELLTLSTERLKASERGLNVLDSILPHLLSTLVEKTSCNTQ